MRIATIDARTQIISADGTHAVDVAEASGGRFGPDASAVYDDWDAFVAWAGTADLGAGRPFDMAALGAPSPQPRQVFAVGLNYRAHADEVGADYPDVPMVFAKFPTSIGGPFGDVRVCPSGWFDFEVELVAVIGRTAREVSAADAWSYVAGLTVGNDFSDRLMQRSGAQPYQWSLAKSFANYGPTGPWLVTPDDVDDPDDLPVACTVNGVTMQSSRSGDLIFSVPQLVEYLSGIVTLLPGDLIFTGTPSGVALGRPDQPWLKAGDEVVTTVGGIGELRNRVIA